MIREIVDKLNPNIFENLPEEMNPVGEKVRADVEGYFKTYSSFGGSDTIITITIETGDETGISFLLKEVTAISINKTKKSIKGNLVIVLLDDNLFNRFNKMIDEEIVFSLQLKFANEYESDIIITYNNLIFTELAYGVSIDDVVLESVFSFEGV